jgi:uncharacterized protein YkwD
MCTKIALEQAKYCISINKLTHDIPNSSSPKNTLVWWAENGYLSNTLMINNIDIDVFSNHILKRWKNSKYHNENLLSTPISGVGLSFEISKTNEVYCFLFIQF